MIVATPDLASLRNTKNMLDVLRANRGRMILAPRLVLNQAGVAKRPEIPVKEFAAAVGVEPRLVLPFDPQVFGTAANNGQMLAEIQPNSRAAEGMRLLAELVTGRTAQTAPKKERSAVPFRSLNNRKAG